jgi:NAD(P)-dependent dehydrogenase (short-subunit alcohol dehydrogenase family)
MENPPGPAPLPVSEDASGEGAEETTLTPSQQENSARDEKRGTRLTNRLALITGASRGLGASLAKRFAAEGAQLVLLSRDKEALEKLDDELRATGDGATLVPLDLRQFDQLDAMAASLHQRFGRLDIFVSCAAALGHLAPAGHFEPALVQEVIDVNFTANWRLIRALDPLLRAAPAGRARDRALLGALRREQSRARSAGQILCRGNRADQTARQPGRSWTDAHGFAFCRFPLRGTRQDQAARRRDRGFRQTRRSVLDRERRPDYALSAPLSRR